MKEQPKNSGVPVGPARSLDHHFREWAGGSAPTVHKPVTLHFCPDLRRAMFVVTDHGDRTREPISRALYFGHSSRSNPEYGKRGIIPSGIRLTQAALRHGWPGHDYLSSPAFYALMKEVQQAGSEVCPHNTCDHLEIGPEQTRKDIEFYAQEFGVASWIDHYRLRSNLTQSGMDSRSEFYVFDLLQRFGTRIAWSFVDRFANPPGDELDLLDGPPVSAYLRRALREFRKRPAPMRLGRRGRANLAALVHRLAGSRFVGNLLVLSYGPRHIGIRRYLSNLVKAPYNLLTHNVKSYTKRNDTSFPVWLDSAESLMWFDSARILFVSESYNFRSLRRLIQNCGVHIGHTYLGFENERFPDSAFQKDGASGYRVRDSFQDFLDELSQQISRGEIWNPTLRELSEYYTFLSSTRLERTGPDSWKLHNDGIHPVNGITLRSRNSLVFGTDVSMTMRGVEEEWWYALDVPPGMTISLRSR